MYRLSKILVLILVSGSFLLSCQKEYSTENGGFSQSVVSPGTSSGTALYVLAGAPGTCTTPIVNGDYKVGITLDSTNNVELIVNVTAVGTYAISTGTTNGMTFSASDSFTFTGVQTIILYGHGRPVVSGTNLYMAGSSGCTFNVITLGTAVAYDCKSCTYIPFCDGSTFTYVDTSGGVGTPVTQTLSFIKDSTISGVVYHKFSSPPGNDVFYNCTSGTSTVVAINGTSVGGTTVAEFRQTLLKANDPVGATWSNLLDLGAGAILHYDWSIAAKGLSRTVLGVTYNDVIKVHLLTSMEVPLFGLIPSAESEYYYANNIGMIETITYDITGIAPVMSLHRVLQSFHIP